MSLETMKSVILDPAKREAVLANSRMLAACTVGFLACALTTKEPVFFVFNLLMAMSLAYRATGAVIAEIKAK